MQNASERGTAKSVRDIALRGSAEGSIRLGEGLLAGFTTGAGKSTGEASRVIATNAEERTGEEVEENAQQEGDKATDILEQDEEKLQCMHFDANAQGDLDIDRTFEIAIKCLRRHVFDESSVQLDREEQVIRRIQNTVERLREQGNVDAKQVESRIMRVSELISRARATMYMADTHRQDDEASHTRR